MTANAISKSARLFRFRSKGVLALAAVCAIATGSAAIGSSARAADTSNTPKMTFVNGNKTFAWTLSLADLDLSSSEGQRMATQRIHDAARQLCLRVSDSSQDRSSRTNYLSCLDASIAAVGPRLQQMADASSRAHALAKN